MVNKRKQNRRKSSGRRIADVPGRRLIRRRAADQAGNRIGSSPPAEFAIEFAFMPLDKPKK